MIVYPKSHEVSSLSGTSNKAMIKDLVITFCFILIFEVNIKTEAHVYTQYTSYKIWWDRNKAIPYSILTQSEVYSYQEEQYNTNIWFLQWHDDDVEIPVDNTK